MMRGKNCRIWIATALALPAAVILCLYLNLSQSQDGPYAYTVEKLFDWAFFPLAIAAFLLAFYKLLAAFYGWWLPKRRIWGMLALFSLFFVGAMAILLPQGVIPPPQNYWLAAGWVCAYFFLALYMSSLAVKLDNWASGPLCLLALLALLLGGMEGHFLIFAPQWHPLESYLANSTSKYVLADEAAAVLPMVDRPYGHFPARPDHPSSSVAQHQMQRGKTLYDVRYTFDPDGRRITSSANDKPEADLLLFGCSFTFGHALENEETWAWRLSELLGPRWRVSNYAFSGFGAQQMLALLEEKAIQTPKAPIKEAMFLAIRDHLYRFSGLFPVSMRCVRYDLRDGKLVRAGFNKDSPYFFISALLPDYFKGSMAVKKISVWLTGIFRNAETGRLGKVYVAMLEKSARLLREEYGTDLTVLLWPDMEDFAPALKKAGINTLLAQTMLKDWTSAGRLAYVEKRLDMHPNQKASSELALGLYEYYKNKESDVSEATRDGKQ